MTKSIRRLLQLTIVLYVAAIGIIGFAKPLSILSTCQRDANSGCDEFYPYFYGHNDGYQGDYSELRDADYWASAGAVLFAAATIFLLVLLYRGFQIYRKRSVPPDSMLKLDG